VTANLVVLRPCWNQPESGKSAGYTLGLVALHNYGAKEVRISLIWVPIGQVSTKGGFDPVGILGGGVIGTHR
jgi:hypothetical protein